MSARDSEGPPFRRPAILIKFWLGLGLRLGLEFGLELLCWTGADGALTKTPQNVVVLRGQDAILNCSTNAVSTTGHNPIEWKYDNDIISHSPCTSQYPGVVVSPSDSATDCNIRALGSWQHGISGAYSCNEEVQPPVRAVAIVIVLGEKQHSVVFCSNYLQVCSWYSANNKHLPVPAIDRWHCNDACIYTGLSIRSLNLS